MNSSTLRCWSSDSSAGFTYSGIAPPPRYAAILEDEGAPETKKPGRSRAFDRCDRLRSRVQDPEARDVGRAVVAFHFAQRAHGGILAARLQLRLAQAELRVFGALQAALLQALVDQLEALVGLAFVHVVEADLDEVAAILRGKRFLLVRRA